MFKKKRKKALEEGHTNNIWNRHDFVMCGYLQMLLPDMLEQYRIDCKDEVMDLMKEHFFALWD